jgi:hypothetical protein
VISNNSTIDYYQRVVATVGQAAAHEGVRFHTVPGMGTAPAFSSLPGIRLRRWRTGWSAASRLPRPS